MDLNLNDALSSLIAQYGGEIVSNTLFRLRSSDEHGSMTVICNAGLHPLPDALVRGEVIEVTRGNLDFANEDILRCEIVAAVQRLIAIVHDRRPTKIYLIPWGPAALSCIIKHAIYRTIGIETIDVLFMGKGRYIDIESPMRNFIKA